MDEQNVDSPRKANKKASKEENDAEEETHLKLEEDEQQSREMMLAAEQQQFGCITLVRNPKECLCIPQTIDELIISIISNKANGGYGFMAIITNLRVIIYDLNADVASSDD